MTGQPGNHPSGSGHPRETTLVEAPFRAQSRRTTSSDVVKERSLRKRVLAWFRPVPKWAATTIRGSPVYNGEEKGGGAQFLGSYYPAKATKTLTALLLLAECMRSWILLAIAIDLVGPATDFDMVVFFSAGWGFVVCFMLGVFIANPDYGLKASLMISIIGCAIDFVLTTLAFVYIGMNFSLMSDKVLKIRANCLFTGATIIWAISVLLQGILHTFLYTYGHMVQPVRISTADIEKYFKSKTPKSPLDGTDEQIINQLRRRSNRTIQVFNGQLQNPRLSGRLSESSSTVGNNHSRTVSEPSLYFPSTPRRHVTNRDNLPAVPIIYCTSNYDNNETGFNPNMGHLRPISIACDCDCPACAFEVMCGRSVSIVSGNRSVHSVSTISENISRCSVSMDGGNDDASSARRELFAYSYDSGEITDIKSNRSSVATFVPRPGQLNMHPTRSYEMVAKGHSTNSEDMVLSAVPQFSNRHNMQQVLAQNIPPRFFKQYQPQRIVERAIGKGIQGEHMALPNFKFGGKPAVPMAGPSTPRVSSKSETVP